MHTPTKLPDLNRIEHVWTQMKVNMAYNGLYANEDEFGDLAIHDAWNRLRENPNFATNLVNSIGERIKAVINANANSLLNTIFCINKTRINKSLVKV
jgi:hypothetical protein